MSARFTTLCFFALSVLLCPKANASITKRDVFPPGNNATNVAGNRRLTSTTNGQVTRYVWSRGASLDRLLAKVNPDNSTTRYIYGAGLLYEETTLANGTVQSPVYYHFDWRGDTIALSDASGSVTVRMSYSAYGERSIEPLGNGTVPAVTTPFCFNGKWGVMTEPTGLLSMQARFYSPVLRRFLNEDPSGFEGGMNMYTFANSDPVDLLDPFGLGAVSHDGAPGGFLADAVFTTGLIRDAANLWKDSDWSSGMGITGKGLAAVGVLAGVVDATSNQVYANFVSLGYSILKRIGYK